MPFKSEAQRRFMYAKHPAIAKEFESATPKGAKLPEHVSGTAGSHHTGHHSHHDRKALKDAGHKGA